MNNENYVVATIKPWNIKAYNEIIKHYPGVWHLITDHRELTAEKIKLINPKFIFFPHWSHIVSNEILRITTCVCFHETDLPYGRGGSPLQNLIALGLGRLNRSRTIARFSVPHYEGSFSDSPIEGGRGVFP